MPRLILTPPLMYIDTGNRAVTRKKITPVRLTGVQILWKSA